MKRVLSFALAFIMLLCAFPFSASAEEITYTDIGDRQARIDEIPVEDGVARADLPTGSLTATEIGEEACSYYGVTSIAFPERLEKIGYAAFMGNEELTELSIPYTVTYIGALAFAECYALERIVIPETVEFIGENAFLGNDSMTAYVISKSYAEEYCKDNGISYVAADKECDHKSGKTAVTLAYPTCTQGEISAKRCNGCGILSGINKTVALGHTALSGECERCGNTFKNKSAEYDRVVVFQIDGVGEYFDQAKTPNIDSIFNLRTSASIEGKGSCVESYASLLYGVSSDVHKLDSLNVAYNPHTFESFFSLVKKAYPMDSVACAATSMPISDSLIEEGVEAVMEQSVYDSELAEYLSKEGGYLENNDPKVLLVQMRQTEQAAVHFEGHYGGKDYLTQLALTDGYIGQVYNKYVELGREENTLFILTSDHGGIEGTDNIDPEGRVIFAMRGHNLNTEGDFATLKNRDVAAIALEALGVDMPYVMSSSVPADLFISEYSAYEETEIAEGVTHTHIATTKYSKYDLQNFNIVEFDPDQSDLYVDVTGGGKYANKLTTVTQTVESFAEATPDKTPIAAVNGDLWMVAYAHGRIEGSGTSYNGYTDAVVKKELTLPRGFNMYNGEIITSDYIYQETPYEGQFWSFGTTADNKMVIGCPKLDITLDGNVKVDGLNRLPANDALIVYSDKGCLNNYALDDAYELLIKTNGYTVKHGEKISGEVVGIYDSNTAENPTMQDDYIILTARGSAVSKLSGYKVGDRITLDFTLTEKFGRDTEIWQNVTNATGGHMPFVVDGMKNETGTTNNYPVTIIGIKNDGNVVFLTNDGRQSGFSTGLDFDMYWDLAEDLDLNTAFILDGGGSAEMVVLDEGEYKVTGKPSDGSERTVVNSVILSVGESRRVEAKEVKKPSEYLDLTTIHFAATEARDLVPNAGQVEIETVEDGLKFTVEDYHNATNMIFSFGHPTKSINVDEYPYLVIDMKVDAVYDSAFIHMPLYATTGDKYGISNDSFVKFIDAYNDGQFHKYIIDLSAFEGDLNTLNLSFMEVNGIKVQDGDTVTVHSFRFARDLDEANTLANKAQYKSFKVDFYDMNGKLISSKRVVQGRKYNDFPSSDVELYIFNCWQFEDGEEISETDVVNITEDTAIYMNASTPFKDVKTGVWFTEGIMNAVKAGYFSGMTADTFQPNGNLTRAQFVLVLAKIDGVDLTKYENKDTPFKDVKKGAWYAPAVAWAYENGYTGGMSADTFGTNNNITREQLARFFYVYAEKNGIDVSGRADLSAFTDAGKISDWARYCVEWAVDAGLISGMSETTIGPRGNATRAQAARICVSFGKLV